MPSIRVTCLCVSDSASAAELNMPDDEVQRLLEDKAGLRVSRETHFGSLLLGNRKQLQIWIQ